MGSSAALVRAKDWNLWARRHNANLASAGKVLPGLSSTQNPFICLEGSSGTISPFVLIPGVDRFRYLKYLSGISADADTLNAFGFAWQGHLGVLRADQKTPYIDHPFGVLRIITEEWMLFDPAVLRVALLHDVEEDVKIGSDTMEQCFGKEVAFLVDGVTEFGKEPGFSGMKPSNLKKWGKISRLGFKDIRVILIKFADRLHNMRTLSNVSPRKQRPKAEETLWYYRPLADALGVWKLKREFEDLSFQYCNPSIYSQIRDKRDQLAQISEVKLKREVVQRLREALSSCGEEVDVAYEQRGLLELVERLKIRREKSVGVDNMNMDFYLETYVAEDIEKLKPEDIWRVNVICKKSTDSCYSLLGRVHKVFSPVPQTFVDHIAVPCPNGHTFLHTYVNASLGKILIHIQDEEMMRRKNLGIIVDARDNPTGWYREHGRFLGGILGTLLEDPGISDSEAYGVVGRYAASIECVPYDYDLVPEERKKKYQLPFGSTILDFAAAVHPQIMLRAARAEIDGVSVPLNHRIHHGDKVRIITDQAVRPPLEWFQYLNTPKARKALSAEFKSRDNREIIAAAMAALNEESRKFYITARELVGTIFFKMWVRRRGKDVDLMAVLTQVGTGDLAAKTVVEGMIYLFRDLYQKERRDLDRVNEKLSPDRRKTLYDTYDIAIYLNKDRRGILEKLTHDFRAMGFNIAGNFTVDLDDGRKAVIFKINVIKKGLITGALTEIQQLQIRGIAAEVGSDIKVLTTTQKEALLSVEQRLSESLK